MPISPIVLQRRQAELGRIRLGQKQATANGKTRPAKLDRFRFTSVSEQYIRDLADLYGGTAQPWDNNGIASWEVITDATSMPVIVVKGGLSQWMETWSGGGCVHRCDGERMVDGTPCASDTTTVTIRENGQSTTVPAHEAAKPTTRLSVMLPELEAIGVWRMETHGWNAAAEIPAVAELAQFVGDLVPAHLHLVERRAIKDGKTSRFVVPVLDLQIGAAKLREVVAQASGIGELAASESSGAPAIEASHPPKPTRADVDACDDLDVLRSMWQHADPDLRQVIQAKAKSIEAAYAAAQAPTTPAVEPNPDGTYEAQVVDDSDDAAQQWQQLVTKAGKLGWTLWQLEEEVSKRFGGIVLQDVTAEQMREFSAELDTLQGASA
ncbi:hypothetical protein [uncultured Aeromicrobium sp.]|uniref:recombination directionality factor n=1 Tax=uncultured Aeromicrobium sp. TaxID=337820 RepID=UPI0025FE9387|nr:hypothetical protein [uncultured Aeromicrobium sp.]